MGFLENLIRRRVLEIAGILNLSRYIAFPYKHIAGDPEVKPFSGNLREVIAEIDALIAANLAT
jgi:hypothetical protein